MNRVRNRLAALFFVITAAAIGFIYHTSCRSFARA